MALAQRSSGISSEFLKTYGLSASGAMRDLDLSPLSPEPDGKSTEVKAGPRLLDDAQRVFREGKQSLAMELFFTHIVAEFDQAQDALRAVRFSRSLRRPVWQIRWAVSLAIHGGDAENANPIPLSGSGGSRSAGATEANASSVLESALGLVATTVADEFQRHAKDGNFGVAFEMLDVEMPAEPASHWSVSRPASTADGAEPTSIDATESILQNAPLAPPNWRPGIVFLGEGMSTKMIEIARQSGVDFLLHFDVAVKTDRDEEFQSSSRCRVIQVADGKVLAVSKGIDRQESDRFTRGGDGTVGDFVKEQLTPVLTLMDKKVKVDDMPPLTPEIAKKRVGALLSSRPLPGAKKPSLRALAEIRMYQSLGLLEPTDVDAAMEYISGDDALFLIYGPLDARLQQARQWAVDAMSTQTAP